MKLAIRGVGAVGGFGCGLEALNAALSSGDHKTKHVVVKTAQGPCEMPAYLADTSRLEYFLNKRALRRVDHYSRMALLGAYLALEDAGRLDEDRSRMGIIIASGYGPGRATLVFLDTFIHDGDGLSSPTSFSNSVQNAAAANISILLNITGPGLTVGQLEMSVPSALIAASLWLEEGKVDSVLFGAVDEYHDELGYFWHRFFGEKATADHEMKPFEFDLQTGIPGEGAAFFLLTRADEGVSPYGCIEDVIINRCDRSPLEIPKDALLFIGADGHKQCGKYYKEHLPENVQLACYTPIYGSLPMGPAFDMAIAALSFKQGMIFPSQACTGDERALDVNRITCLKISGSGEAGLISLIKGN
ncbi:MAG: beta-ketoacyl synthase [Syntrophus sp. (in: bacteria)]|nr:beta-ketoacyl synthase [Syntrophus sp. (in: bacteria)]